ncbi:MAG: MgtC/SapB family protein [Clostridia bacterium]|nr:MgtC/SapB family protein [Clostridia bacterium]
MTGIIAQQAVFFVRLLLACVCGGMIGYERTNRGKGAGIRTHVIVALASALMMLVSKYGFTDMVDYGAMKMSDGSRIAAQVVSGVGFLGAGMIYFNGRHSVKGLTTAAGIWATSGVGLAIGAGMYAMGIITSVLIVTMQIVLHKNIKILQMPNEEVLAVVLSDDKESIEYLNNVLEEHEITVVSFKKCSRTEFSELELELNVTVPPDLNYHKLLEKFQESKCINSISL